MKNELTKYEQAIFETGREFGYMQAQLDAIQNKLKALEPYHCTTCQEAIIWPDVFFNDKSKPYCRKHFPMKAKVTTLKLIRRES